MIHFSDLPGRILKGALALAIAMAGSGVSAQAAAKRYFIMDDAPPAPEREFRAMWVTTVHNVDWPSRRGLPAERQQAEMIAILDRMVDLNMNAVVLQVRSECDALYYSEIEPWSPWLTGEMGKSPGYDPLAFTITEAHRRGIEVHAWFNPYRAINSQHGLISDDHVSRTNPEAVRKYGKKAWLEPTLPFARDRALDVIRDVVTRYQVDGVHIDDYFYPYPEPNSRGGGYQQFDDSASWAAYQKTGGDMSRSDWRRHHVSTFVRDMNDEVKKIRPWIKVGVSPFGVWRPGYPAQVKNSLDAYEALYADVRLWWHEGWMDYLAPQLYWSSDHKQLGFAGLYDWWRDENKMNRHLWPGIATYRIKSAEEPNRTGAEPLRQIGISREHNKVEAGPGHIHFSAKSIMENRGGVADLLEKDSYHEFALTPEYPWLSRKDMPDARLDVVATTDDSVILNWEAKQNPDTVRWWLFQASTNGEEWNVSKLVAGNLNNLTWVGFPKKIAVTPIGFSGETGAPAGVELRDVEIPGPLRVADGDSG